VCHPLEVLKVHHICISWLNCFLTAPDNEKFKYRWHITSVLNCILSISKIGWEHWQFFYYV
jgi:hypothetical protein